MKAQQSYNTGAVDYAKVPQAPLGAFESADWHEVPRGFYALPVHDWTEFSDECTEDETPPLDLLGFLLFTRCVPVEIKTGPRAGRTVGRHSFTAGPRVLARGVQPRIARCRLDDGTAGTIRYTPSERLKREVNGGRFISEHVLRSDGDTSPACSCPECNGPDGHWYRTHWKPAADQRNAYANEVAAVILYSIQKEDDAFRKLYGLLTGKCGVCGRLLTDPESKRLGLGPDCGGRR